MNNKYAKLGLQLAYYGRSPDQGNMAALGWRRASSPSSTKTGHARTNRAKTRRPAKRPQVAAACSVPTATVGISSQLIGCKKRADRDIGGVVWTSPRSFCATWPRGACAHVWRRACRREWATPAPIAGRFDHAATQETETTSRPDLARRLDVLRDDHRLSIRSGRGRRRSGVVPAP